VVAVTQGGSVVTGTRVAVIPERTETLHRKQECQMVDKATNIVGYLESGIKAESLRQQAISSNIANSQTPGYRRIDVRFADIVADAMADGKEVDPDEIEQGVFRPMNTAVDGKGNDVNLDGELGDLIKNSMLQKTYMKLLARKYRQIETAIGTGGA
jgi:flagellar basal-body rod protein FlgB